MKKRHKIFRYLLLLGLGALLVRFYLPSKAANFLFNHEQNAYGLTSSNLHSSNVILEKLDTQEIIYEKNKDEKIAIASLTKIMTAYILLTEAPSLDAYLTVDPQVINELTAQGASLSGFIPNDQVTVRDLAYGILLPSGGDAAIIVANWLAGSEAEFAKKMNQYAKDLNMSQTQFKNATGLDQSGHYSTVNDLRILLTKALKNLNFYHIFTTFEYQTIASPFSPNGYYLASTLLKEKNDLALNRGTLLGGKTGYTKDAGLCLASIAEIDGELYLLISARANGDPSTEQFNLSDAKMLYNQL